MKYLISLLCLLLWTLGVHADNFLLTHGQSASLYLERSTAEVLPAADRLFSADYEAVFGATLEHTRNIADARIIACTYDHPELRRYARLRGLSFEQLSGLADAFILKVHNAGRQLFVVGSTPLAVAHGLMTLSRQWGVSPFGSMAGAPPVAVPTYELGVAYEHLFTPSVRERVLVLADTGSYAEELFLRLRATQVMSNGQFLPYDVETAFNWSLDEQASPYHSLHLTLCHPERLRLEGQRAYQHGCTDSWQLYLPDPLSASLQAFLFFDMAWDAAAYADSYALERLADLHYTHLTGLATSWNQLWSDYYDLPIHLHPEQPLSVESLRRGIGESQSLTLQLSLELNNKVVRPEYRQSFFRTVEYPVNMLSTRLQHLCNQQLVAHGMANSWSVDDGAQRMRLLLRQYAEDAQQELPDYVLSPSSAIAAQGASYGTIRDEDSAVMLYRSTQAIGAQIQPYEPLVLPLNHQAASLHLRCAFLPIRQLGKPSWCMVSVDNGQPRVLQIVPDDTSPRQLIDLSFEVDPTAERHTIAFRTISDGIWLQRVWLLDIEQ